MKKMMLTLKKETMKTLYWELFFSLFRIIFLDKSIKKNAKRIIIPRSELAGFFFGLFKFGYSASLLSYSCFEFFNIF